MVLVGRTKASRQSSSRVGWVSGEAFAFALGLAKGNGNGKGLNLTRFCLRA